MNKSIYLFVVCLLCILFCSCAGLSDWTYEINDSYVIGHIGPADNHLLYSDDDYHFSWTTIVGGMIFEFQYNDRFVGVNNGDYYLVDMTTGEMYGPIQTVEEYNAQCTSLETGELCEWIQTKNL